MKKFFVICLIVSACFCTSIFSMKKKKFSKKRRNKSASFLSENQCEILGEKMCLDQLVARFNGESKRYLKLVQKKGMCTESKQMCESLTSLISEYQRGFLNLTAKMLEGTGYEKKFQEEQRNFELCLQMFGAVYFMHGAMKGSLSDGMKCPK